MVSVNDVIIAELGIIIIADAYTAYNAWKHRGLKKYPRKLNHFH
jgi:hypothetical protein